MAKITVSPGFINMPLQDYLLGSSDLTKDRQELMIFIQPKIINTDKDRSIAHCDLFRRFQFLDETMDFAMPEIEARAYPVEPIAAEEKKGLIKKIFQLDQLDK